MITGTIIMTLLITIGGIVSVNEPWENQTTRDYRSCQEILAESDTLTEE